MLCPTDSCPTPKLKVALVAGSPFLWARGTPVGIPGIAQRLHDAAHEVHVLGCPLGQLERRLLFRVHRSPGRPRYRRMAPGADPLRLAALLPMLAAITPRVVRRWCPGRRAVPLSDREPGIDQPVAVARHGGGVAPVVRRHMVLAGD